MAAAWQGGGTVRIIVNPTQVRDQMPLAVLQNFNYDIALREGKVPCQTEIIGTVSQQGSLRCIIVLEIF